MSPTAKDPGEIISFWRAAGKDRWFASDPAFDATCRAYRPAMDLAASARLDTWSDAPAGALALVLLLDQFPRHVFRGTGQAYATDQLALENANRAIAARHDLATEHALRQFFYLPFTHAEDLAPQRRGLELCRGLGEHECLRWAEHHADIIARFGRFPHRNVMLGRASTPAEVAFMAADGFRG